MTDRSISRGDWVDRITNAWGAAVESVFAVGRELAEAKASLEHGNFEAMIKDDLPFSASTARRLMTIADDARLQNVHTVHDLPASWGTLYELTKLEDPEFEKAMTEAKIRADMTRADAAHLRTSELPPPDDASRPGPEVAAELDALAAGSLKFAAILADPPWEFVTYSDKGQDRSPEYPTMSTDEICALPIGELAAKDAVLFLWGLSHMVPDALAVIDAWGFEIKTRAFVWVKRKRKGGGLFVSKGFWTRHGTEDCWLATRGAPKRRARDVDEVVAAPIHLESSRKPAEVQRGIERLVAGPYVELFARRPRAGWTVWGNQVPPAAGEVAA